MANYTINYSRIPQLVQWLARSAYSMKVPGSIPDLAWNCSPGVRVGFLPQSKNMRQVIWRV